MSQPSLYNFPDSYQNDGITAFSITLRYEDASPVNLIGSTVLMQLKNSLGNTAYEFSNIESANNHQISVGANGVIQFPEILSFPLASGSYVYDLQVKDSTGFIRTYIKGSWKILSDISKP